MGISSSMNAGVSGLTANANKLSTISDNIANSETYGYKRADVDFQSLTLSDSSSPNTIGGGRWFSAGGVTTDAIWDIGAKGNISSTLNATDIAINGRGFLPVTSDASINGMTNETPFMLTSTGSFSTDSQGYLKTNSGLVLMGWPAASDGTIPAQPRDTATGLEPIQINRASIESQPTSQVALNANLPSTDTAAGADGADRVVTVQYYDNLGAPQTLTYTFTPTVPAAGAANSNQWTLEITDEASGRSAGTYALEFGTSATRGGLLTSVTGPTGGALASSYDADTGVITLNLGEQSIEVGLGSTTTGPNHLTQKSTPFLSSGVTKDGSAAGTYQGLSLDKQGRLSAVYSSGFTKVIYQVPVADVANPNGMRVFDNQTFGISDESGSMYLWDAGSGPVGSMQGYALEESATDIATELTQLIQTQRAYSSNAKVIQTVDQMLEETTNLKR